MDNQAQKGWLVVESGTITNGDASWKTISGLRRGAWYVIPNRQDETGGYYNLDNSLADSEVIWNSANTHLKSQCSDPAAFDISICWVDNTTIKMKIGSSLQAQNVTFKMVWYK